MSLNGSKIFTMLLRYVVLRKNYLHQLSKSVNSSDLLWCILQMGGEIKIKLKLGLCSLKPESVLRKSAIKIPKYEASNSINANSGGVKL
ncbi:hypothetical protein BpHYR1_016657 [Brachionus plicatilis]|uniref:Uncharacterized protein n=1 Tax=Brachionus plicatilis TaxID=10195 RepID=A0A3M7RBB9_BRAPC|nr:hypothetical protein BpHYR1_016657 [Brachionus plicatilis]